MKNVQILSLTLVIVSAAFLLISVLVVLTGGKNKYLISKKLRLGAMIIGMTCLANGCRPFVTCYEVAMAPVMVCQDSVNNDGVIVVNKDVSKINFNCMYLYYEFVSYKLSVEDQIVFTGDCIKTDTDTSQNLEAPIPRQMNSGNYLMKFYYVKASEINENSSPFSIFNIKVIN
ncbi:MAG TPA: hypothetical protein PKN32_12510 [Bacteroidales bacterium]|nr:hypothetical protein [Bacteroidales bacterium]